MSRRVLLVDDEPAILEIYRLSLEYMGYEVLVAEGGIPAFDLWKNETCDIVVSDMRMPNGGGLQLLEKIRKENKDFPVIIMTGFSDQLNEVRALNPQKVFTKPLPTQDLIDEINQILTPKGAPQ